MTLAWAILMSASVLLNVVTAAWLISTARHSEKQGRIITRLAFLASTTACKCQRLRNQKRGKK